MLENLCTKATDWYNNIGNTKFLGYCYTDLTRVDWDGVGDDKDLCHSLSLSFRTIVPPDTKLNQGGLTYKTTGLPLSCPRNAGLVATFIPG